MASPIACASTVSHRRWKALFVAVLSVMAVAACGSERTAGTAANAVTPQGFDRVRGEVTDATGSVCEVCLWVADTAALRARGMMGVTDMGAADAMGFFYDEATTGRFWMKDTALPLSIAFFDAAGEYLDGFDMEPCTATNDEDCPRYDTPVGFTVALEVPRGGFDALGVGPGSELMVTTESCTAASVPRID